MHLTAHLEKETTERAGDIFRVIELRDDKGRDRTDLVDQGKHYHTVDQLRRDIARETKRALASIHVEEV